MNDRREEPTVVVADPSECPICGEWRDTPTADCSNCGWMIRPCGDALGLCIYRGSHDGPHKFAGSWAARLRIEREAAAPDASAAPDHRIVEGYCFDCAGGCVIDGDEPTADGDATS